MNKLIFYILIITANIFFSVSTIFAQAPVISSFTPANGRVGTIVTITGTNFNTDINNNIVFFGATRSKIISASSNSLVVQVPIGATFQPISILNTDNHLTGYSSYPFNVTFASKGAISALYFNARVNFPTGEGPASIGISDLDGDGKPDMVVANRTSGSISIYRNTATSGAIDRSSFAPSFNLATNSFPNYIEINDVDGDGKPDILVANNTDNNISVFKNIAIANVLNAGSFKQKVDIATTSYPYVVKTGDIDNDGKPDIAVTYATGNVNLSLLKNTGTSGTITTSSFTSPLDISNGNGYFSVCITDLNNNGKSDLVLTDFLNNTVSVFNNITTQGSITASSFEKKVSYPTAPTPLVVNTADIDGDGKNDLVISNLGDSFGPGTVGNFYLSVLLNNTTRGVITSTSFSANKNFNTGNIPQASTIGDLDGDGRIDAVTTDYGDNTVSVFHNISSPGRAQFDSRIILASEINPQNVKIADIDGDGIPDLLIANNESNTISIYRNNASNKQSINFPPLQSVVYGSGDFNAGAVSNNPANPIIYTSSNTNIATIVNGHIHITGAGTTTITATQAGGTDYDPATPVSQTLVVTRALLQIKADDKTREYKQANPTFTTTYSGLVNGDNEQVIIVSFALSTTADENSVPGKYPITFTGDASTANYTITYLSGTLTIGKISQSIVFTPLEEKNIDDNDFELTASASSGLPINFTTSDPSIASITNGIVHLLRPGVVTITARQSGNEYYKAASATQELRIGYASVTLYSNTITPNGDGINDTWIITGLEHDLSATVTIFNRYGTQIFQTRGYANPFNGTYNGKKLPAGIYYYVISFEGNKPSLSGSLTIVY
ncbi:FG-GAP-like repeat-containing protein [Mucilaginibacter segetis]|uniref:VCBS repeat-containing protein n=1 Tax=Mucilaginibacter segetis TaxID=2793071 RepID=A0A934PVL5_9SPHI|nr:FG-GAP-like repeat-containing protein [Mucilaginibacter segetis]MBK0380356.1 VCBS repeat-containing protein [Mucilaginibacter segetis]